MWPGRHMHMRCSKITAHVAKVPHTYALRKKRKEAGGREAGAWDKRHMPTICYESRHVPDKRESAKRERLRPGAGAWGIRHMPTTC